MSARGSHLRHYEACRENYGATGLWHEVGFMRHSAWEESVAVFDLNSQVLVRWNRPALAAWFGQTQNIWSVVAQHQSSSRTVAAAIVGTIVHRLSYWVKVQFGKIDQLYNALSVSYSWCGRWTLNVDHHEQNTVASESSSNYDYN